MRFICLFSGNLYNLNILSALGFERDFPLTEWSARQLDQEALSNIIIRGILSNGNVSMKLDIAFLFLR